MTGWGWSEVIKWSGTLHRVSLTSYLTDFPCKRLRKKSEIDPFGKEEKMNLYELDSAIEQIINNGFVEDEETGEILFDSDNLDELEQTRAKKVENIALWIKNNESLSSAIREEEAALSARRKVLDKKAQILKYYLLNAGVAKFESAKAKISTRKVESVEIADERIIPAEYMREKVTKAPAKTEIKKAIKAGTIVPGASIKEEKRITVK